MSNPDMTSFKKRLVKMRDEVQHLSTATEEGRKPVELDQSMVGRLSRMDALQGQAMQLETERRRGIEMQRINAALSRIDNDEFGYCVTCGEDIEEKRIEHDPTAPTCMVCARG